MSVYNHIDLEKCNEQARQAGRAAHICRNYLQGFINLEHPELQTVDGLMGQIEGQFRTIRSNLVERKDIKPQIKLIARSSRFIQKILEPSFIEDSALSADDINELRDLACIVHKLILCIDQEINTAILKESSSLFKIELPKLSINDPKMPAVLTQFECSAPEAQAETNQKLATSERKAQAIKLSKMMSNRAHSAQDLVAEHIQNATEKDHANQIINLAGGIENESRAIIAQFNSQSSPNIQNIHKHINTTCDLVSKIRQFVEAETFLIKNKKAALVSTCEFELKIAESLKLILQNNA